jgi:hypothetical protein
MNQAPQPRVVLKSTTKRDAVVAGLLAIVLLAMVGFGIIQLGKGEEGNTLSGKIVGKEFIPLKETTIEFKGRTLTKARESDGEYLLKVRVDSEAGRVFEVPVPKQTYQAKKEGDSLKFVRPPEEQK